MRGIRCNLFNITHFNFMTMVSIRKGSIAKFNLYFRGIINMDDIKHYQEGFEYDTYIVNSQKDLKKYLHNKLPDYIVSTIRINSSKLSIKFEKTLLNKKTYSFS